MNIVLIVLLVFWCVIGLIFNDHISDMYPKNTLCLIIAVLMCGPFTWIIAIVASILFAVYDLLACVCDIVCRILFC